MQSKLDELKAANVRLLEEKDNAVKSVEQKYRDLNLNKSKSILLNSVPFDFSDLKPEEVEASRAKTQNLLKGVFDAEYSLDFDTNGNEVVKKGNDIIKNEATREPVPAKDVLISLAKEYGMRLISPDSGGQGGKSSAGSNPGKYSTIEEFEDDMKKKGISTTSSEYVKSWIASGLSKIKK